MFKSVFAKYVTACMLIITVGFALLLLIVTGIVAGFSERNTSKMMESAAKIAATAIQTDPDFEEGTADANAYLASCDLSYPTALISALIDNGNALIVLTDESGNALQTVALGSAESPSQITLTPDICGELQQKEGGVYVGTLELEADHWALSVAMLTNEAGESLGFVAILFPDLRIGGALAELTQTIVTSALLALLAILIAVYFITERTISPLREMSHAARSFAAGRFDVRVRVRGRDEVAELATAFNQMADSLENLEKLRNSFVANVSHDLRTPMTTIAGFIDSIRDGVIPPEEQDHYLEIVSIEVHRLSRLVSSLLDLSRIQAGDRKFTMKTFDICEMARLILISFEKKIDEKRLDVEFECEDDRMMVIADRDAIYQIFYNICHNAVKFARDGGKLRIRIENTKEKKLLVSVYNEGEGIPLEDQAMIFERFYKSDKSRGLDKSGVGLGLYIAKTIINAHGERIGVRSNPGKDCEFYFTLQRAMHHISRENEDK